MQIAITTTSGDKTYEVLENELPEGATAESVAHVFADALSGQESSQSIVQHTVPGTYVAFNADHVVCVEIGESRDHAIGAGDGVR